MPATDYSRFGSFPAFVNQNSLADRVEHLLDGAISEDLSAAPTHEQLECIQQVTTKLFVAVQGEHVSITKTPRLTPRQREVLILLANGEEPKAIAGEFGVSVRTVRWHIENLLGLFEAKSYKEVLSKARRLGML